MNHNLANDTKMWRGNRNNTKLLFSLKGKQHEDVKRKYYHIILLIEMEILHEERKGQSGYHSDGTLHNSILFHKCRPTHMQHTYQLINQSVTVHHSSNLSFPLILGSVEMDNSVTHFRFSELQESQI